MFNKILCFLLCAGLTTGCFAQKSPEKVAKNVAKGLCKCINKDLKDMDDKALDLMINMVEAGEDEGQEMFSKLSSEERALLEKEISKLSQISSNLTSCLESTNLKDQIQSMDKTDIDPNTFFIEQVVPALAQQKKCKSVYAIMMLGMKQGG